MRTALYANEAACWVYRDPRRRAALNAAVKDLRQGTGKIGKGKGGHPLACGFENLQEFVDYLGKENLKVVRTKAGKLVWLSKKLRGSADGGKTMWYDSPNWLAYVWQWPDGTQLAEEIFIAQIGL